MANTYTQLFVHIIFVVKGRQNIIPKTYKDELYKYITGIIKNKNNKLHIINGMPDHIHLLVGLNPGQSLSSLVKEIKRSSSKHINEKQWIRGKFEWQAGYAAFSYSKSQVDKVYHYINNQEDHHRKKSFREEYLDFLRKYDVKYDERYIFDEVL